MTKSQLTIHLSSKKMNRHVCPIRPERRILRLNCQEIPRITFVRASKYVEFLLDRCVDETSSKDVRTSTHLVTFEVKVTDQSVEHICVVQRTLNAFALCMLQRDLYRLEREIQRCADAKRYADARLVFNFGYLPDKLTAQWVSKYLMGDYE